MFFAELKRRQMFRVAAAYAVVAWLLLQLFNNLTPLMRLPEWAGTLVLVFLVGGFPITLLAAWARELAPDAGATARLGASKLDYVLIGALVLVITLVSYQQLAPPSGTSTAQQATVAGAAGLPAQAGAISIAVLPLANLSGDAAQEFFSDGMTDEITAALAKVQTLRVVGRSSAFQFKGQNRDLRAIGQALAARYLIDGSVRKAGERVRITAQLIEAANGVNVWTETYDRELTDVFAIQEDIATAIATALRVPLGLRQGESVVPNQMIDPESYEKYLRARALVRARGMGPLTEAAALLEPVVARNPDYAPAWALLALAYGLTPTYHQSYSDGSVDELRQIVDASLPRAEAAALRAIELAPSQPDGYVALGRAHMPRGKFLVAEDLFKQALVLDPNNSDALHNYSGLVANVARPKEALVIRQQLRALEPFVPVFNSNLGQLLWVNGQNDAAITMLKALPAGDPARGRELARVHSAMGHYSEAADALAEIPSQTYLPGTLESAIRIIRTAPEIADSPQNLPRIGILGFVYLHIGAPTRALEYFERNVGAGYFGVNFFVLWHPSYAPMRKTERFKALMRDAGLVEYWRARGWPDLCRPVGADDFVCD
jgi:TolB-like protein/Tfp pilus assembly protein PilF